MSFDGLLAARGLPSNLEAERLLLGLLLRGDPPEQAAILNGLKSDWLTTEAHRTILAAANKLYLYGRAPDTILVAQALIDAGTLDRVGGLSYLSELDPPRGLNIGGYLDVLREKWVRREAIAMAQRVQMSALTGETATVQEELERYLSIGDGAARAGLRSVAANMEDTTVDALLQSDADLPDGISLPWPAVQDLAGVLRPNEMTCVAGPTGGGKSSWARQVIYHAAKQGTATALFSMEMSFAEVARAMACAATSVNSSDIRRGRTDSAQRRRFAASIGEMEGLPLYIDDHTSTVSGIEAEVRRLKSVRGCRLVVVDHFHLLDLSASHGSNETARQEHAANRLRALARSLDLHLILLAQYDKSGSKEQIKERLPTIYDISGSKAIANAAQRIILLHPEKVGMPWPEVLPYQLILGKNRGGRMGAVPMGFERFFTRFVESLDSQESI